MVQFKLSWRWNVETFERQKLYNAVVYGKYWYQNTLRESDRYIIIAY